MYRSATYAAVKQRRLRSIERRATRELSEAFAGGALSLRKAEMLSRLSPARQRRILRQEQLQEQGERLAAQALHDFLAQEKGRIDLKQVARRIVETIRQ
jgi:hypothetical protein